MGRFGERVRGFGSEGSGMGAIQAGMLGLSVFGQRGCGEGQMEAQAGHQPCSL